MSSVLPRIIGSLPNRRCQMACPSTTTLALAQTRRYRTGDDYFRILVAAEDTLARPQAFDQLHLSELLPEAPKRPKTQRVPGGPVGRPRWHQKELREPFAVRERQRPDQRCADHGEDGRGGANYQRERGDDDDGVDGPGRQATGGMAEIAEERVHPPTLAVGQR
jgi:hypothetical protein